MKSVGAQAVTSGCVIYCIVDGSEESPDLFDPAVCRVPQVILEV